MHLSLSTKNRWTSGNGRSLSDSLYQAKGNRPSTKPTEVRVASDGNRLSGRRNRRDEEARGKRREREREREKKGKRRKGKEGECKGKEGDMGEAKRGAELIRLPSDWWCGGG